MLCRRRHVEHLLMRAQKELEPLLSNTEGQPLPAANFPLLALLGNGGLKGKAKAPVVDFQKALDCARCARQLANQNCHSAMVCSCPCPMRCFTATAICMHILSSVQTLLHSCSTWDCLV